MPLPVRLPQSHATLYEWVAGFERTGEVLTLVKTRWTGKQRLTDTYRYLNDLYRCATATTPSWSAGAS